MEVAMKNFLQAMLLLAFTPPMGTAQNSKQYLDCSHSAQTQTAMNACADQEFARADAALTSTYHALLAKTAHQPDTSAKIKSAQRAWLLYRDAYLEAMFPAADKPTEYGSMHAMQLALLRAKLTRWQTAALKDLLRQHDH
jgi:uncharacterized protein YecT (DUF1311 family)